MSGAPFLIVGGAALLVVAGLQAVQFRFRAAMMFAAAGAIFIGLGAGFLP